MLINSHSEEWQYSQIILHHNNLIIILQYNFCILNPVFTYMSFVLIIAINCICICNLFCSVSFSFVIMCIYVNNEGLKEN